MGHSKSNAKEEIYKHIRKEEISQINNLTLQRKELEKEEPTKNKTGRRKKIIRIRAEINEINNRKTIEKNQ